VVHLVVIRDEEPERSLEIDRDDILVGPVHPRRGDDEDGRSQYAMLWRNETGWPRARPGRMAGGILLEEPGDKASSSRATVKAGDTLVVGRPGWCWSSGAPPEAPKRPRPSRSRPGHPLVP